MEEQIEKKTDLAKPKSGLIFKIKPLLMLCLHTQTFTWVFNRCLGDHIFLQDGFSIGPTFHAVTTLITSPFLLK